MPGVTVLPNSSGLGGFGSSSSSSHAGSTVPTTSTTSNGFTRFHDDMTVAEIKIRARENVQKEARGASPLSLIRSARSQVVLGKEYEAKGDLRNALGTFTKAASLAKMTMDSAEFMAESQPGKSGVLRKEFTDFFAHDGSDLSARTTAVEEKLKTFEKAAAQSVNSTGSEDTPVHKTIADRVRSLEDNGMSVGTAPKRFSRELPISPTPIVASFSDSRSTTSATTSNSTASSSRLSTQGSLSSLSSFSSFSSLSPSSQSSSSPSALSLTLTPSTPISSASSPHAFVSPSTFGPPSPSSTSSPSSSPQLSNAHFNLTEFAQTFPSIDELDESDSFKLPSVPTTPPTNNTGGSNNAFRTFTVPVDRPSSTPITPTANTFASRPGSPARSPMPSALTSKPSSLGLSGLGVSDTSNVGTPTPPTPSTDKPPIPKTNIASPRDLHQYIKHHNVLLLDVRNRSDFEREHIKAGAVACIEPSVLMRDNVTGEMLEDTMVIAPRNEGTVFMNREKFDLVAVYDQSSTTFGGADSPISILVRAIHERAFKKMLKRMPMLLVGGIDGWKKDIGEDGIVRGGGEGPGRMAFPEPQSYKPSPSPHTNGDTSLGLTNGNANANGHADGGMTPYSAAGPTTVVPSVDPHQLWTPRSRADTNPVTFDQRSPAGVPMPSSDHKPQFSLDHGSGHSRSPAEISYPSGSQSPDAARSLVRRPALTRPPVSASPTYSRDNLSGPIIPQSMVNGSSSITYPQFPRHMSPTTTGSASYTSPGSPFVSPPAHYDIASPPQASINPSLSRRRSDYVDQSQEALFGLNTKPSIDYPELSSQHVQIPRPPPIASPSIALERQENHNRPRTHGHSFSTTAILQNQAGPKPPRIHSDYPVTYWSDIQIGTSGLKNLGNTCYMNAPIQCLSASVPFARFFTDGRWKNAINFTNPMGSQGKLARAFASLLHDMWQGELPYITPLEFRKSIVQLKSQYSGSDQHDSQEFLSFLLDGIHEDLNRIMVKPVWAPTPEQEAELERLPQQIASEQEWRAWRTRNDSLIVDFFQGQFRNRLECLTCRQTSTTYNVFSILQLPVPQSRSGKVSIQRCLDAFFNTEVMEKDDAWDCPKCKVKRKATKQLSLARLPPILLIHLKRFETRGRFSDKIDTFVDYPLKSLDLTNLMPPPLPPGADKARLNGGLPMSTEDPRTQLPPYRYDLYGVTNHFGNLSSGHYTAFIASRGGWMSCDDSSVRAVDAKQVVNQKAYVLFYKRTKT